MPTRRAIRAGSRSAAQRVMVGVGAWSTQGYAKLVNAKRTLTDSLLYPQLDRVRSIDAVAFDSDRVANPMSDENVVGVGVGQRVRHGEMLGELCVKIYVQRKVAAEHLGGHMLPASIGGIPTDVEEVGMIRAFDPLCSPRRHDRIVPAPCGFSIGHQLAGAGTIGAVVRDRGSEDSGTRYILSNNHILAAANRGSRGDIILQPGPLDGGTAPGDEIGKLERFVPLDFTGFNKVDAAIAGFGPGAVDESICGIGPITGTTRATPEMTVFKHGRTTGMTRGVITDVSSDIRVAYATGFAIFEDQILIRGVPPTAPFSQPGDSGSAIVDSRQRLCGLLFSGSVEQDTTWANPIRDVFARLQIKLP